MKYLSRRVLLLFGLVCAPWLAARAQGNYEIQVYGSETVAPANTMVELHSNYTVQGSNALPGSRYAADGTYPTTHQEHETVEITQGIKEWMEVGFYIFTSIDGDSPGPTAPPRRGALRQSRRESLELESQRQCCYSQKKLRGCWNSGCSQTGTCESNPAP